MGITNEQLTPVKAEFQEKYFFAEPYAQYVNGCGVSTLGLMQELSGKTIDLKNGESLDDLCLSVKLRKAAPTDLEFPSEFKGVRVFYKVYGPVVPYKE